MKKTILITLVAVLMVLMTIKGAIAADNNLTKVTTRFEMLGIITGCQGTLVQNEGGMECVRVDELQNSLTPLDRIIIPAIVLFLIWLIIMLISPKNRGTK